MIDVMIDKWLAGRVVELKPRPGDLEKVVHALAMDSKNVRWQAAGYQTHTVKRSTTRDITDQMMFEVLRTGMVKGDVEAGKYPGEWKIKLVKQMKGRREVGVVTIVVNRQKLFVKTVEWEDLR